MARRPMQDWLSWKSYGTARVWSEVGATPSLASEVLCQHIASLGGINLSEQTRASIAAAVLVGMYGSNGCACLQDADLDSMYQSVKASVGMHSM